MASSSRSEPWKLIRMPRSKFCSASPLTTAARWKTTPVSASSRASAAPGSLKSPTRSSMRGSSGSGGVPALMSLTTIRSISCSAPSLPCTAPRSSSDATSRRPRKPVPPVTRTFTCDPPVRGAYPRRSPWRTGPSDGPRLSIAGNRAKEKPRLRRRRHVPRQARSSEASPRTDETCRASPHLSRTRGRQSLQQPHGATNLHASNPGGILAQPSRFEAVESG